jgi:hypothetical protein
LGIIIVKISGKHMRKIYIAILTVFIIQYKHMASGDVSKRADNPDTGQRHGPVLFYSGKWNSGK